MLKELDVITLTYDIQEHGLKKGTQGAIVHCYDDQQAYEVEFVNDAGETLALLTLGKAAEGATSLLQSLYNKAFEH